MHAGLFFKNLMVSVTASWQYITFWLPCVTLSLLPPLMVLT